MHCHRQRPQCCRTAVSSAAMADGNAALQARDIASATSLWHVAIRGAAAHMVGTCGGAAACGGTAT